jgi:hypothetical protein
VLSSILELLGMLLIVIAVAMAFGPAAAVAAAGVCCLVAAWAITRSQRAITRPQR